MNRKDVIVSLIALLLVLGSCGALIWALTTAYDRHPACDVKVCDCKCIGTVSYKYIPIKLDEIDAGCK